MSIVGRSARGRAALRAWMAVAAACASTGCFPTVHTARVDPGFRLDAGATMLADRRRNEPTDYAAYVAPAYGIGHRVEIGVPIGVYLQHGLRPTQSQTGERQLLLLPYVKLALHDTSSRHHAALLLQSAALIIPSIFGFRYGRDLGSWEPQAGITVIRSGGPAGDDPVVTRYQQLRQSLIAVSIGATWDRAGYPGVELGVLRNAFDEDTYTAQGVPAPTRRTLYDVFVGMRVSTGTLQQQARRREQRRR